MNLFHAMDTCRAIRFLKPDPVPEDLIQNVVHGATRASNPEDVLMAVSIALGFPGRSFGPVKRKPVAEILHWDRWSRS